VTADVDAESALRAAVLDFVETVRGVERTISAARRGTEVPEEFDVAPLGEISEEEWREHWPANAPALDDRPQESAAGSDGTADADVVDVESSADATAADA
jgi:XTP/dITP diphosphohydrolase